MAKRFTLVFLFVASQLFIFSKIGVLDLLSGTRTLMDLDAYHLLAKDVINGINPYTVSHMQTLGPPMVLLFYLPFGFLKLQTARVIVTLLNLTVGYLTIYLVSGKYFKKRATLMFTFLSLLYFSSFPFRFTLEMGQIGILLTFLMTVLLFSKNNNIKGAIVALAIILRTYFIYLFTSIIRKRKLFITSLLILGIVILFSFFVIKPEYFTFYLNEKVFKIVFSSLEQPNLNYYQQSLQAVLTRFGLGKYYFEIYLGMFMFLTYQIVKRRNIPGAIIASIILSPISWQHYYVILFPVFIFTFMNLIKSRNNMLLIAVSLYLWWVEFPFLHIASMNPLTGLLASHYFLSGIILYYLTEKVIFKLK